MHMATSRTTLNIDQNLLRDAREMTGILEKTALIHEALRQMIAREAARRLIAAGGTMPDFEVAPRRRSSRTK